MPAAVIEAWLESGQTASISGLELMPRRHPIAINTPLSVSRGQAEAFYLQATDGSEWIAKKFHRGHSPEEAYLRALAQLIPTDTVFRAGTGRRILTGKALTGGYCTDDFAAWLSGTVLMPKVNGVDLPQLAKHVQTEVVCLPLAERARLCVELATAVLVLESHGCAHRDLSATNVYVDTRSGTIALIDWDSMYHGSLQLPHNATLGTAGYLAPFVWCDGPLDILATWNTHADRFALAVCCVELFLLGDGPNTQQHGGLFPQEELSHRTGPAIVEARHMLAGQAPAVLKLFERALFAENFAGCPSPDEWLHVLDDVLRSSPMRQPANTCQINDEFVMPSETVLATKIMWPVPELPPAIDFRALLPPMRTAAASLVPSLPPDAWEGERE